jgi:DNA-binding transcriptional regulator GbsR (MarR family)
MVDTLNKTDAVEEFIERMGVLTQADGGPRIAGRLFGLVIVENRPMSLQEMAERLQVSKASISTNARQLARAGFLRLTTRPGSREDLYELPRDPYRELVRSMTKKLAEKAAVIAEIEELFTDEQVDIRERVHHLAAFHRSAAEVLDEWYDKLPPAP